MSRGMDSLVTELTEPVAAIRSLIRTAARPRGAIEQAPPGVATRVAAALRRDLCTAAPTVEQVAVELAMSARSLHRQLAAEGTSYQRLLDGLRCEEAIRQALEAGRPFKAIAAAVGFADPRAFRRAFKRWTGTTPQQFRIIVSPRLTSAVDRLSSTGMTRVTPWLSVHNATAAVAYYKAAFAAIERERLDDGAGGVAVALLSIDGAELWIQADPDDNPHVLGGRSVRMILSVDDPDAVFARAVAAGATVVAPVAEGHGWRIGRIADPSGHHWEIGKRLAP